MTQPQSHHHNAPSPQPPQESTTGGVITVPPNGIWDPDETWVDCHVVDTNDLWPSFFTAPVTEAERALYAAEDFSQCYINGEYDIGEAFVDDNGNGVWDTGEAYVDDRNGYFDYGTTATGSIAGLDSPYEGTTSNTGGDVVITPPDLAGMHYDQPSTGATPAGVVSDRWGYDVLVSSNAYGAVNVGATASVNDPHHIFLKNPPNSLKGGSSGTYNGVYVSTREYYYTTNGSGDRIKDDFFLEDPASSGYRTGLSKINVQADDNNKTYYVDGNMYIHSPEAVTFMFQTAGTKLTIVANGNIFLQDEFWYNGGTADPQDMLCLIALKDTNVVNSGNIYLGDPQFSTQGQIHSMLYAENDFTDNSLDTVETPTLAVFGNMSAGNQINIERSGSTRTQLEVTLDDRIREAAEDGSVFMAGLPPALEDESSIGVYNTWQIVPGKWRVFSPLGDFNTA